MDGLAIAIALSEISHAARGARFKTVKEPLSGVFVFTLRARSTFRLLVSPPWSSIHRTELALPTGDASSPFVMQLRKLLQSTRVEGIEQRGLDRVVRLSLSGGALASGERLVLVAELIGTRGNLVLIQEDVVIACWRPTTRVRIGESYIPLPHQDKIDPTKVSEATMAEILGDPHPVDRFLRSVDGFGRQAAERVLAVDGHEAVQNLRELATAAGDEDPWFRVRDRIVGILLPSARGLEAASFSAALDATEINAHQQQTLDNQASAWGRRIRRALRTREQTVARLQSWLAEADPAALRRTADILLTHAAEIPRGASHIEIEDPATGERIGIDLDPSTSATAYAQRLYHRARRISRGTPRTKARLQRLSEEVESLRQALRDMDEGRALSDDVRGLAPSVPSRKKLPPQGEGRTERLQGYIIRIGRSASENDRLLRTAKAQDLWLHVHGAAGAHVIIRRKGRDPIPRSVVREAARLAVRHSKKRGEARAQVTVAEVRHVRKPKGAPPGLVRVGHADTLTVVTSRGGKGHATE
jgi:predicted ribosome quality control (RQC) complex YloA/Tae2 family protein